MPFKVIQEKQSNTSELACNAAFVRATRDISEWHGYPLAPTDIRDFLANITSMISHKLSPDEYFDYIGCGAFKECYEGLGNWVIKFASNNNETGAERQILSAAIEDGVEWAFLPTIFIDLPEQLPSIYLEGGHNYYEYGCFSGKECSHECSSCPYRKRTGEADTFLTTAILQPRGFTCADAGWESMDYSETRYNKNPLIFNSGKEVPFEIFDGLNTRVISWFRDVIRIYGDDKFLQLCDFIEKFDLSDLHEHNIGYITTAAGNMPILLDWLSREPAPSETCSH